MNSKIAVQAVLDRQTPPYIPIGTYAIDGPIVEKIIGRKTYVRNKVDTQLALWAGRRDEVAQSLIEDAPLLFEKLRCIDIVIPYKEAMLLPPVDYEPIKVKRLDDKTWQTSNGDIYRASYETNDISLIQRGAPSESKHFTKKAAQVAPPHPSIFEAYDRLIEKLQENTYLAGVCGGLCAMPLLGGMQEGLMQYLLNPDTVREALTYYETLHRTLDPHMIRDGIDAVFVEEDYAMTTGPFLSPDMFQTFCLPFLKKRIRHIKRFRDKVMLHCCGDASKLMPMLADAGIDGYQSMQTGTGMQLDKVIQTYPSIAFWGGVAVETLIEGSVQDVRRNVRDTMQKARACGSFILGPSHSIACGVSYDNFMAMLDEHDRLK